MFIERLINNYLHAIVIDIFDNKYTETISINGKSVLDDHQIFYNILTKYHL